MAHITEQDFALAAEDLVFHAMHKINRVYNNSQSIFDNRVPATVSDKHFLTRGFDLQAADQENDRLDEQIKKLDNM